MVDVSAKEVTAREAVASGLVAMSPSTRELVSSRALDKGDALEVARIAGIMAAKKTSELIPLCHPIGIDAVELAFEERDEGIGIVATVRTSDKTGVEMEALSAVSVAALTIYDMVKATERGVEIREVKLLKKSGGRSGTWTASG
ncbi:MAG: cyclic pyranopterin monophosphate synthase MoaC [Actinobacteria bacterium]|nr:cyclic pyranopterin monophosphate synthase MoaC [Actinomycetota bacterium]